MSYITIKIIEGLNGKTSEIIVDENITIKELKKKHVAACAAEDAEKCFQNTGVIPEYTKEEKAVLAKKISEAKFNFKFALGTEILDDDTTLKEVFKGDVLVGELTLSAIRRPRLYAKCLSDINKLDLIYDRREKLVELERILREETNEEDPSILASSDEEIVLAAVQQNGLALQFASPEIQAESAIVLKAMQQNVLAFRHASEELKDDYDFVLKAVQQNGLALRYAPVQFQANREIVLAAVQQNILAFMVVPSVFKADREFILEAVKQNGWALRWATEDLKKDREIVLKAVQQNGLALEHAASELRNDREIVLAAVQQNGAAHAYAAPELKNEIRSNLIAFTAPSNKKTEVPPGKSSRSSSNPSETKKNHPFKL
jgi:hypothetical protein